MRIDEPAVILGWLARLSARTRSDTGWRQTYPRGSDCRSFRCPGSLRGGTPLE